MTGKLADKLPLTMSSLINTIPDSLYSEEDIPTSMNIFTNTDSINHYSQMNTGKNTVLFMCCAVCCADLFHLCSVKTRVSVGKRAGKATVVRLEERVASPHGHLFALYTLWHTKEPWTVNS